MHKRPHLGDRTVARPLRHPDPPSYKRKFVPPRRFNGCIAGTRPTGTQVEVDGASRPGTIVYSSWVTMQAVGEADSNTCRFNDFALIQLDPADYGATNPTIPFWGGPTGITGTTALGDRAAAAGRTRSTPSPQASRATPAARSSTARAAPSAC